MKLGYFYPKPCGAGIIASSLQKGFADVGSSLQPYNPSSSYDYVLLFNCADHRTDYNFDGINSIKHKFAFIDTSEYGWWTHHDSYKDRYYNAFAPSTVLAKPNAQQQLISFLKGKSYPYFIREYYKGVNYHKNYHPIDYPLHTAHIPIPPLSSFEDYKNRPLDVYISWGPSHMSRASITEVVDKLPLRKEVSYRTKVAQQTYFNKLSSAKLSVSYDGYGSGSFRETEALCRTTLLRNSNMTMVQRDPIIHLRHFIEYGVEEARINWDRTEGITDTQPRFTSTDISDIIMEYIKDTDLLYEIYRNGYNHCVTNFTEKATAQYIINILQSHNWGEITPEIIN